jgi:hypothetical protein
MSWLPYKGLTVPSASMGDAGQNLTANFETLADRTSGTSGSVIFINASGYASQDNSHFFWDETNYGLTIVSPALGSSQSATAGLILSNTTVAANGAQQLSPPIHFKGQGWQTTTPASQAVEVREYLVPVQGATNPTAMLTWDVSINGGSWSTIRRFDSSGNLYPGNSIFGDGIDFSSLTANGNDISIRSGTGVQFNNSNIIGWSSGGSASASDTALARTGASILKLTNGSSGAGNLQLGHLIGASAKPSVAADAGAGSGSPTLSLASTSTDLAGQINLTTAAVTAGANDVVTVSFSNSFGSAPNVLLSPANANAAAISGTAAVYVTSSTTSFKVSVGSAGLASTTNYIWNYVILQ